MVGPLSAVILVVALSSREGRPADTIETIAGNYIFYGHDPAPRFELVLTPEGRFSVLSLQLHVIEKSRGRAEFREGHLILKPERSDEDLKAWGFLTKFIPIHWGGGLVLVPEGRERDVCNIVNLGLPFDSLRRITYLRKADEQAISRNYETHDLPPAWSPMLLKAPIEGRVIEVLADRRARVDFGSDRGAMTGLTVCVRAKSFSIPFDPPFCLSTVVEVFPNECIVAIDPSNHANLHFEVGKRVYTRVLLPHVNPMTHCIEFEPAPTPKPRVAP